MSSPHPEPVEGLFPSPAQRERVARSPHPELVEGRVRAEGVILSLPKGGPDPGPQGAFIEALKMGDE
jgi:hypothetical protein